MVKSTLQASRKAKKRNMGTLAASSEVTYHNNPFQRIVTHTNHTSAGPSTQNFTIDVGHPSPTKWPKVKPGTPDLSASSGSPSLPQAKARKQVCFCSVNKFQTKNTN
jgi:hypothetical protein